MVRLKVKLISLFLTFSMMLSMGIPIWAQAEEKQTNEILFFEDFEQYSVGTTSLGSGYAGGAKTNKWAVVADNEGKKHFRMQVNTASDMHLDKNFTAATVTGDFILTMDLYFEDYNNVVKAIYIKSTSGAETGVLRFIPSGAVTLGDGTVIANYATGKFYTVAIGVHTSTNKADIYFNGKKRAADVSLGTKAFTDLSMVRVHMREVAGYSNLRLDNLGVYKGLKPIDNSLLHAQVQEQAEAAASTDSSAASVMGNSVGLHVDKSNALIKGVKGYISTDESITPYWDADTAMVPLKFFAESLGGSVTWDGATQSLVMKYNNKTVTMKAGNNAIDIDGQFITLSKAPALKGGSSYIPVVDLCELLGLYCFSDESDLIIYGEEQLGFTWVKDGATLRKIAESFIFDDVEGAQIVRMIKEKNPNQKHPRLIMTDEKFAAIRENLASENPDPVYVELKKKLLRQADDYLPKKASGYEIRDGVRLLYVSQEVKNKVMCLAMAYQLTYDERYAERAWLEMYNAACFVDWHPWHMLDVGEMTAGLSFGYDWLYHWLDDGQRKIIREAIIKNGFYAISNDYNNLVVTGGDHKNPLHRSWYWRGGNPVNNWRFIAGGGTAVGAIALCDELSGKDLALCEQILSQSLLDIRAALSLFAPAGAYPEGLGYWGYATSYFTFHIGSLMSAAGDDFGYTLVPGIRHTTDFVLALNGTASVFNYGDAGRGSSKIEWPIMFFAKLYDEYPAAQARINTILKGGGDTADFFYYDPKFLLNDSSNDVGLDAYLKDSEVYSARSGRDEEDIWVALHCGDNFADHGQYDMGTFVLDAMGENFFLDLGADDYNINNRFTQAYRYRAEGHNTIVINPSSYAGQIYESTALIDKHESKPQGAYAISDMTTAYADQAIKMRRGIKLDNYRRMVTVQDEVRLVDTSDFWWFAHTEAEIEISEDGKSAYLTKDGKTLLAEIINGEGAAFSVMDAKPLETSPKVAGNNPNEGIRKLVIHIPECKDLDLAVTFKKYDTEYFKEDYDNTFVPLDEWDIPEGECVIPYAQLDGISINGKPLEGFSPDVYTYEVVVDSIDYQWGNRQVGATAAGEVIVTESESWSDTVFVTAKGANGKFSKSYAIKFIAASTQEPVGKEQITPVSVTASRVPQAENNPENTLDGDMETRWSCDGICWIEYDLGAVYDLNSVSIAFWLANERLGQFDIEISQDGHNYVKCFDGDALKINGLENHKLFGAKARYVRFNCYGYDNVKTNWNSVLEVKMYKE